MHRLAFEPPVGLAELTALADERRWRLVDEFEATGRNPHERVWAVGEAHCDVHGVDNAIAGVTYAVCVGADCCAAVSALRAALPCIDLEEALTQTHAGDEEAEARCADLLAVLVDDAADARAQTALRSLLHSPHARARLRAIVAVASIGWVGATSELAALAAHDPQDFVRWRAADTLQAFERVASGP